MSETAQDYAGLIERRDTHLLEWLRTGYDSCQHGSKDWCQSYLDNARDQIIGLDAALRTMASEMERVKAEQRVQCEALHDVKTKANERGWRFMRAKNEWKARAEAAEARLASARKVMEPFATFVSGTSEFWDDDRRIASLNYDFDKLTVGLFRAARNWMQEDAHAGE